MNNFVYRAVPITVLLVFLLIPLTACASIEDRTFWGQSQIAANKVAEVLIRQGICELPDKLCAGYYYAVDPIQGGFEFITYDINDATLLEEIQGIVLREFNNTPDMKRLVITAYDGDGRPPYYDEIPTTEKVIYRKKYTK